MQTTIKATRRLVASTAIIAATCCGWSAEVGVSAETPALIPAPREMTLLKGTCASAAEPKVERVAIHRDAMVARGVNAAPINESLPHETTTSKREETNHENNNKMLDSMKQGTNPGSSGVLREGGAILQDEGVSLRG